MLADLRHLLIHGLQAKDLFALVAMAGFILALAGYAPIISQFLQN